MQNGNVKTFKLGADPEFRVFIKNSQVCAKYVLEDAIRMNIGKIEKTDSMFFCNKDESKHGTFGLDGRSYIGEIRPTPSEDPYELADNIGKCLSDFAMANNNTKLITLSSSGEPVGGHIHFDTIYKTDRAINSIEKILSIYYLPIFLGENIESNISRVDGSGYGKINDFRTEIRNGVSVAEFRTPSAEWITTRKVATGTLCYIKTILHEIYNNRKNVDIKTGISYNEINSIHKLFVTKNEIMISSLLKKIINKVKTFELYECYKKEIDFILNFNAVLKEKNKHNNEIVSGWNIKRDIKSSIDKFLEAHELTSVAEETPGAMLPMYNDDESCYGLASAFAEAMYLSNTVSKREIMIFGLKENSPMVDKFLIAKIENGKMMINSELYKELNTEEVKQLMLKIAIKMFNKSSLKHTIVGIPSSLRKNINKDKVKKILRKMYLAAMNKHNFTEIDIKLPTTSIPIEVRREQFVINETTASKQ